MRTILISYPGYGNEKYEAFETTMTQYVYSNYGGKYLNRVDYSFDSRPYVTMKHRYDSDLVNRVQDKAQEHWDMLYERVSDKERPIQDAINYLEGNSGTQHFYEQDEFNVRLVELLKLIIERLE